MYCRLVDLICDSNAIVECNIYIVFLNTNKMKLEKLIDANNTKSIHHK